MRIVRTEIVRRPLRQRHHEQEVTLGSLDAVCAHYLLSQPPSGEVAAQCTAYDGPRRRTIRPDVFQVPVVLEIGHHAGMEHVQPSASTQ
jgi:hypothetical protein